MSGDRFAGESLLAKNPHPPLSLATSPVKGEVCSGRGLQVGLSAGG
jgi:hypothetical protein